MKYQESLITSIWHALNLVVCYQHHMKQFISLRKTMSRPKCTTTTYFISISLTELFVLSRSINFLLCVNLSTYRWLNNVFAKLWLWETKRNFTIYHSPSFTGFSHSPHFILPLAVTFKSFLYRLYLPPLSQPNRVYVFLIIYFLYLTLILQ